MKNIFLILGMMLCLSACTARVATMTVISDKNIKTQKVKISQLPQTKNIVGESKKFVFLFIPFGVPSVKEALDDALSKGDGDLMLNASLYARNWWFLIGETGYELRGTVVNTQKGGKQ